MFWDGPVVREFAGEQLVFAAWGADRLRCSESPAGVAQQAEQPSCKRQASGSNPLTGSQVTEVSILFVPQRVERMDTGRIYPDVMPRVAKGHIEQLPSGSFRVSVYAGIDPLTRRAIRLKSTVKTEQQARIELGRLLKDASEGRTPESGATVATLMEHPAGHRDRRHPPRLGGARCGRPDHCAARPRRGRRRRARGRSAPEPQAAWSRARLPPGRVPSARLPPDEAQHDPRYPQHPVRRVRRRAAVGVDRPQPH